MRLSERTISGLDRCPECRTDLLACDLAALTGSSSGQPTAPAVTQATPASQPPTTSGQPAPATSRDALFGKVSDPSELNSYRARMLLEARPKDGSKPSAMRVTMAWVKNPRAEHFAMGEGADAIEIITIGDKSWIKMCTSWIEAPAGQQQNTPNVSENYLPEQDVKVQAMGDDTVNGVRYKRQAYTGKVTVTIPAIENKPATKLTVNVKGEVCIANQAGLPPVIVREKAELEGNLFELVFWRNHWRQANGHSRHVFRTRVVRHQRGNHDQATRKRDENAGDADNADSAGHQANCRDQAIANDSQTDDSRQSTDDGAAAYYTSRSCRDVRGRRSGKRRRFRLLSHFASALVTYVTQ